MSIILKENYNVDSWNIKTPWYRHLPSCSKLNYTTIFNVSPNSNCFNIEEKNLLFDKSVYNIYEYPNNIYGIFTFSPQKIIAGILRIDGTMQISRQLIYKIADKEESLMREFLDVVKKMLVFSSNICKSYFIQDKINTVGSTDLTNSLLTRVLNQLHNDSYSKMDAEQVLTHVYSRIDKHVKKFYSLSELDTTNTKVLYNKNSLYRRSLLEMHKHSTQVSKDSFVRGLNVGTKVFAALISSGFSIDEDCVLSKEVDITPEFCIYEGIYWKIPKENREYNISKIIFIPSQLSHQVNLQLTVEGKHPNVSGSSVICIGEENVELYRKLISKEETDPEDLVTFFTEIEKTLHVINYDSSYYSPHKGMRKSWESVSIMPDIHIENQNQSELRRV